METTKKTTITVEATVKAPVEKVWQYWSEPQHITKWCQASDDWHAPYAENDLRTDGKFRTTTPAKDRSLSFDLEGAHTNLQPNIVIEYVMPDGREAKITVAANGDETKVTET